MGFSPGLMQGLLNANTAMTQAQVHQRTASHLESRANILETEIKSGHGDIEGKQAELEQVHAQQDKVRQMQQDSINQAGSALGAEIAPDKETNAGETKTDTEEKKAAASDKAKEQASKLQDRLKDHNIAAVDYTKDLQISEKDKTTTAISPAFLEKLAEDDPLADTYAAHLETMSSIESAHEDSLRTALSHTWSVDSGGMISHHTVVAAPADAAAFEETRQQLEAEGRAAFGTAFGGAHVSLPSKAAVPAAQSTGLLVNTGI